MAGWSFLCVTVLVGVAAIKSQAPFAFVLFGVMVSVVTLSATLSARMVTSVRLRRQAPPRAWQNQTVHIGYYLRNIARRSCLSLSMEEVAPVGIESVKGYCLHLPARRILRAGSRFTVRRRGRIELFAVELRTSFPFGLIRAGRRIERSASLMIWPARGRLRRRLLCRGAVEVSHAAPSPVSGGQDEFFGLREYRPGDSLRWIHWRRSAARSTPVVREMSRPLPEILWLIVDTRIADLSEVGVARRERVLRLAATLVDHAFARDYQVALALALSGGVRIYRPAAGRGQRCTLLDALAEVDANTTHRLADTLGTIRKPMLQNAQVIVLVCGDAGELGRDISMLRMSCRHLTVVDEQQISRVFDDDPLAAEASACP